MLTKRIMQKSSMLLLLLLLVLFSACGDSTATSTPAPTIAVATTITTTAPGATSAAPTTAAATPTPAITVPFTPASSSSPRPTKPLEIPTPTLGPNPNPAASPAQGNLADMARKAVESDMQRKYNLSASDLQFITTDPTEWSDSSLGCPQPGMSYMQVLTPGFQILVLDKIRNVRYEYHTDTKGRAVSCNKGP